MSTTSDASSIELPPDLSAFCAAQWPRLVRTLSLMGLDVSTAEDLAQEALARLCLHWKRVSTMAHPGPWLNRVAVNLALSQGRRERNRARVRLADPNPVDETASATTAVAVRAALLALPERERLALVLRYFADLSVADTATVMGCPATTVKYLTYTAVGRLRTMPIAIEEVAADA